MARNIAHNEKATAFAAAFARPLVPIYRDIPTRRD